MEFKDWKMEFRDSDQAVADAIASGLLSDSELIEWLRADNPAFDSARFGEAIFGGQK